MTFLNIAFNYRSSSQQKNVTGVSPEAHGRLIVSLDEALKKLSLTEAERPKLLADYREQKRA